MLVLLEELDQLIYVIKFGGEEIAYLKDMMGEDNFNQKVRTILMQSNISMWDEFRDRADIIRKHNNIISFSFRSEDEKNNNSNVIRIINNRLWKRNELV